MLSIGITGTQRGMTEYQRKVVKYLLKKYYDKGAYFHHGDCIGVDVEAADFAKRIGYHVIAHPCILEEKRGFYEHNDEIRIPIQPLARNKNIVNYSEIMIVVPKEEKEILRSGTWATYRYLRAEKKLHAIVWPKEKTNLFGIQCLAIV